MRPLYPAILTADEAVDLKWTKRTENIAFFRHLLKISQDFPSVLMAYAADAGLAQLAGEIGRSLLDLGINVFLPEEATPVCAFSQSISARQVPIGLYLSLNEETGYFNMMALTNHGGPIDENDLSEKEFPRSEKTGVLGTTDYNRVYIKNLAGFADPYIEDGACFKSFSAPFPGIIEELQNRPETAILFASDTDGYEAVVSNDGQGLQLRKPSGQHVSTSEMCEVIVNYLIKERLASGTIVGPAEHSLSAGQQCEVFPVEGSLYDMNYHAGFSDLLIGWWNNGIIAHQGSSCFGDGILTAIYYLEALRSLPKS
jgi:hypothetical protein